MTFEGGTQPPGAARKRVRARLTGSAASERQLGVELDEQAIAALGGQGTFQGVVTLACARASNHVELSAPLSIRIDLFEASFRGSARERELVERARRFVDFAGIRAADSQSTLHGLVVAHVRAGSLAGEARLARGDTITDAGGVAVHSLRDLAPAPGSERFALRVQRVADGRAKSIELSLAGFDAPEPRAALQRLVFLLALAMTAVCSLRSTRALAWRQLANRSRFGRAETAQLGVWGGPLPSGRPSRLRRSILPALLSAAGVWFLGSAWANFLALRSISLYFGFAALSVALTLMNGSGGLKRRLDSAAAMLGRMCVLGVLLSCACALSGTRSLAGMVAEQGAWPWQWAGLQRPALLLACPLYCAFAAELGAVSLQLGASSSRAAEARSPMRAVLEWCVVGERVFTNVALCALGVVVFAGGWQTPGELARLLPSSVVGGSLFVLKTWALAAVLSIARRQRWGPRLRHRGVLLGCTATIALTALWLWLDPELALELEVVFGRALLVALALLGAWLVLERRMRARSACPPAHDAAFTALSNRARSGSAASAATAVERYP